MGSHLARLRELHAGLVQLLLSARQFARPGREALDLAPDQLAHAEGALAVVQQLRGGRVRVAQLLLAAQAARVRGAGRSVPVVVPVVVAVVLRQRALQAGGGAGRLVVPRQLLTRGAQRVAVGAAGGRDGAAAVHVGTALHGLLQTLLVVDGRAAAEAEAFLQVGGRRPV